jgi:hypothetical protein
MSDEAKRLRAALGDLQYAVHEYVRGNSTLGMSGRRYNTPSVRRLDEALIESRKATDPGPEGAA